MSLGHSMHCHILAYAASMQSNAAPAAQPRMPIFTEGSNRHVTITALRIQEMSEEMRNQ